MTVAIDNERTKLAANALDRASTASLAVGIFAPLATLLLGQAPIPCLGWRFPLPEGSLPRSCYVLAHGGCLED